MTEFFLGPNNEKIKQISMKIDALNCNDNESVGEKKRYSEFEKNILK